MIKENVGQPHFEEEWEAPNIYYIQPYALDMLYGKEINKYIDLLPSDAWIVLTDYDTCFLTPNYGRIINNAIITYGDSTELFTCQTNRLGNPIRCYGNEISRDDSMKHHIGIAEYLEHSEGHNCEEVTDRTVAGMCMIFKKSTWQENKFDNHPIIWRNSDELTSFDVRWTRGLHGSFKRIKGLYIWHTYRLNKNRAETDHLII